MQAALIDLTADEDDEHGNDGDSEPVELVDLACTREAIDLRNELVETAICGDVFSIAAPSTAKDSVKQE